MAVLIEAISVKRRTLFEYDNTPFSCLEAEVNTPTARGGQTLVRLKIRNLLTNAVFEKTFKAGDKFKEPDLQTVPTSYLYSDSEGSHFLDQDSFETLTLPEDVIGNALDFLTEVAHRVAEVQRQSHRRGVAPIRGVESGFDGAWRERRFVKRDGDQAGDA